ncbi:IclR family transcriptional regulator [Rhizobium sp. 11515TR]|uniref:IclR family transcriptional regulator n=1 Tax=Rhizobium sp. 11515TR TaxID=2028343 RepID=UPI000BA886C7|nr:IclR family transcriptional regulator [Rhizobium sp. 11515TR]ASW09921.1 IclR family transcriptional regulator [Rhizobium sp. 11515TR]
MESESGKLAKFDAVDRAVAILAALGSAGGPSSLSQIARKVGLSQPTTSRYLSSLVGHGYLERDESGLYVLGIGLYLLGQKALQHRDVRNLARPQLELLHQRYNETVSLALWVHNELVVIDCIEATQALKQGATVGLPNPWHASSLGKSILAWLDETTLDILLPKTLDTFTKNTLSTKPLLEAQFQAIRSRGFAVDDEESSLGGRCIGAPVFNASGRPMAAISISGPISRIVSDEVASIGNVVAASANEISRALGYQKPLPLRPVMA